MIDMIPGLKALLGYFQKERHLDEDRKDQALNAIYVAACETKIYFEKIQSGSNRSRKVEEKLARLWAKAAPPVRRFDRDLASRCLMKSEAWISPHLWKRDRVKENRIGIDEVYEDARRLLMG